MSPYTHKDDITTLATTAPCTRRLLRKLQENISWACIKIFHYQGSTDWSQILYRRWANPCSVQAACQEPWEMVWCKPKRQGPGATTAEGDQQWNAGHWKYWAAWEAKDLVCAVWPAAPGTVASYTLWGANLNCRKNGKGNYELYKKMAGVPHCLTSIALYGDYLLRLPLTSMDIKYVDIMWCCSARKKRPWINCLPSNLE